MTQKLFESLRPDALKALRQLAAGTPAELVPLTALRALERVGLVEWASEGRYTRVLTDTGRQAAAALEQSECA